MSCGSEIPQRQAGTAVYQPQQVRQRCSDVAGTAGGDSRRREKNEERTREGTTFVQKVHGNHEGFMK
jgi:hypothetical protein